MITTNNMIKNLHTKLSMKVLFIHCLATAVILLTWLCAPISSAQASGSFKYVLTGASSTSSTDELVITCSGSVESDCPDSISSSAPFYSEYAYQANSNYTFVSQSLTCKATISVPSKNSPSNATYHGCDGSTSTVTISSPSTFSSFFDNGGNQQLNKIGGGLAVKANVVFGSTNSSLSIPQLTFTLDCADNLTAPACQSGGGLVVTGSPHLASVSSQASEQTLSSQNVQFSNNFGVQTKNQHYKVCASADFLDSTECKTVLNTDKPQTVTFNLKGDISKLAAQNGSSGTQLTPSYDPAANGGNCSDVTKCDLIQKYINPLITFMAALVGIAVVLSIVIGGIQYGSSGGDPAKVTAAKNRIRNAIIALITFLFLYALLNFLIPGGVK